MVKHINSTLQCIFKYKLSLTLALASSACHQNFKSDLYVNMARKKTCRKRNYRTIKKRNTTNIKRIPKPEPLPKRKVKPHISLANADITTKTLNYAACPSNVTKLRFPITAYESFKYKFVNYDEIEEYLKKMEKNYPGKFRLEILGDSIEGRPIYLAAISDGSGDNRKMLTLVEAGSNACDWLAISSALYLVDFLTRDSNLVKLTDYYILPCSNPDAYHKCVRGEKFNTNDIPINLSNNFPILLGTTPVEGISTKEFLKAMEVWKRNVKFSSPTTKAIFRAATCSKLAIQLFISLQEEGNHIVYPFGFCNRCIPDKEDLKVVANSGKRSLKKLKVHVGSIYEFNGLTYGSVIDFLKFSFNHIKFMYIFHIRDKGKKPHIKDILVYGEDVLNCVKSMARNVYMYYNKEKINKVQCT